MDKKTTLGLIRDSQQILSTFYGDLAQPSVKKVGIALETTVEFCTSILLPVKYQSEKWKLNFQKKLNDYKDNLEKISEEKIIEVNPQIGAPILEKLSYITNEEISIMFINLLTKASSIDTVNIAHPSFVQIIERLSVDEAKILNNLDNKDFIPYVNFRLKQNNLKGYIEILGKGTLLQFENDLLFPQNINTYIDNLISTGILSDKDGTYKVDEQIYVPLLEKYDYEGMKSKFQSKFTEFKELQISKSYFEITSFGKSFLIACSQK
ncbi:DUF4393 domain-containing protein [Chryseobacterium potabilaquae]|uniref:DUF4393 domain-containing protein n=1 Tax=Chryseobacterium potabilaquae TaxID=2675057 RepID=A0A6N4XC04_9FLAO|nr:DUF4393 domain-containing protein [Chryseobacterium potabilaquae]CAA7197191.1 hypothetical protein CHRY9293_03245 [Chryseobacterium potabilaquae]